MRDEKKVWRFVCDRCKAVKFDGNYFKAEEEGWRTEDDILPLTMKRTVNRDVCPLCAENFAEIIENFWSNK